MMKLLIVDDDEGLLEGLRRACGDAGFDADFVDSGTKAIDHIRSGVEYSLVITDLRMPGLNGQETIKVIKQYRPAQNVAVMSGFADAAAKKECEALGVTKFISKNLNTASFVAWVHEALGVS